MRKLITFSIALCSCLSSFAQSEEADYVNTSKPSLLSKERISTSIEAGTGVLFGGQTAAFTTYVAPKINYQLSHKFRLNVGFMHYTMSGNSAFYMNPSELLYNGSNKMVSGNLVSVGGDYLLNKHVIVSGSVMTDVTGIDSKNSYKAANLGVEYKFNNSTSLKIETTISNGQGNYYQNPFGNNSFGASPTGSMFDSTMGTGFR
jgi:hypothetical protein